MKKARPVNPDIVSYFANPTNSLHRQYLAMRSFFFDGASAEEVSTKYGYTVHSVYSMTKMFKKKFVSGMENNGDVFFRKLERGRPKKEHDTGIDEDIVSLRKKQLSVPDIKVCLDSVGHNVSESYIYNVCDQNGFARLPKRSRRERLELMASSGYADILEAPEAGVCTFDKRENFSSKGVGILCFLPFIKAYGIDKAIEASSYPETKQINRLSSILAFLALKLSDMKRYGQDNGWCMDRGLGMFAGLNVLPKSTWFSTYANATMRGDNVAFMKSLNKIFSDHGFLSDTANLDFTAIPYWGDEDPFENNWSGKRGKAIISIQAALAQDPDTGILCYGDTTVKHDNQNDVILEFLDFYREGTGKEVKFVVFDSKFTTLENLGRINGKGIKFITIQRKSKNLNAKIEQIHKSRWKSIRIEKTNHKARTILYCEDTTTNKLYGDDALRQIFIKGSGIKPSTIITNSFNNKAGDIIQKYARRWLIENDIAEHIHFFHLNRNSSGIVVKVDFDLTMTILAHNLYRLLAEKLPGYSHCTAQTLYSSFIDNFGDIDIDDDLITVKLNRKRALPLLRESLPVIDTGYHWLGDKNILFTPDSHS